MKELRKTETWRVSGPGTSKSVKAVFIRLVEEKMVSGPGAKL
jgi:hypothetical protein